MRNILGAANAALRRHDAAIESHKQVLKIKPDHAEAYGNMGFVPKSEFDLDTGLYPHMKKAFKIEPNSLDKIIYKKSNLKSSQDFDAPMDSFEKAVVIEPNFAKAKHLLACINGKTPLPLLKLMSKRYLTFMPEYLSIRW